MFGHYIINQGRTVLLVKKTTTGVGSAYVEGGQGDFGTMKEDVIWRFSSREGNVKPGLSLNSDLTIFAWST